MNSAPFAYVTVYPSGSVQVECFWTDKVQINEFNFVDWADALPRISAMVSVGWDIAVTYFGNPDRL